MNMNMPEKNSRFQPPPHRRKTPSFSASLLDSILRSIDESNDEESHEQIHSHDHNNIHDIVFFDSDQKRTPETHLFNEEEKIPSLKRAIMIEQWMETHNRNGYVSRKSCSRKFSSDSSSSGTTSSETDQTPSTYRSLPNSFTISRKTAESFSADSAVFRDDTDQNYRTSSSAKHGTKFMKSTKLKAMKIYGDLKKAKQPMSPGSRISSFLLSLFSKKSKMEEKLQNSRSLKKSRSIKQQDAYATTSFSRSCMSKKQHNNGVKRSVRFYPEKETVVFDRSTNSMPEKIEKRWFSEKNYVRNYKKFTVNNEEEEEDEDEDEDDLFELEIIGGVGSCVYGQELPVFETTNLRRIRI